MSDDPLLLAAHTFAEELLRSVHEQVCLGLEIKVRQLGRVRLVVGLVVRAGLMPNLLLLLRTLVSASRSSSLVVTCIHLALKACS